MHPARRNSLATQQVPYNRYMWSIFSNTLTYNRLASGSSSAWPPGRRRRHGASKGDEGVILLWRLRKVPGLVRRGHPRGLWVVWDSWRGRRRGPDRIKAGKGRAGAPRGLIAPPPREVDPTGSVCRSIPQGPRAVGVQGGGRRRGRQ